MTRSCSPAIGEVDDLAAASTLDGAVGGIDEALQALGKPVITARRPAAVAHALLDHRPAAVVGDDEAVEIEIEAVLNGGAVHLGDEPADSAKRRSVEAGALASGNKLFRSLAAVASASAADMDSELG